MDKASVVTKPKRTCVLHVDAKLSRDQVKPFDESSWRKVKTVDTYRRSHSHASKYLSVKLPEGYDDTIGYHTSCYKNFTALSVPAPTDTHDSSKQYVLRSNIEGTTSLSTGIFPPECLFCGHVKKSKGRDGKEAIGNCETEVAAKSIYDAAVLMNDVEMLARISGVDMIAKEVKYHHSCKRSYLRKSERDNTATAQVHDEENAHDCAFIELKNHITDNLIEAEGAELLTSLHAKYIAHLEEGSTYAADTLRQKIMNTFPQLKQCKQSNKKGIIIYNGVLSEETAIKRATFDHNSIIEAAFYLRGLIKTVERTQTELPDTLTADSLAKGQAQPPEDLLKFFRVLYTGSTGTGTSDKVSRLVESTSSDVLFATSRGVIKPGKHLLMGLSMKSITGSRKVINILNRMGHSISYHLTEEMETRLATEIVERNQCTPDGLSLKPGLATALAWDNFDQNIETLSGRGTVHDTVGICYQNVDPDSLDQPGDPTSHAEVAGNQKKKKQASRLFSKTERSLEPYRKKPKMSKFDYERQQIERPLNLTQVEWRDLLWMLSMKLESAPLWKGWNARVTNDPLPLQNIEYMDNISLPPTQLNVEVETLRISQKVAEECGEQYAVVTYDLAIAKPAHQIQAQESPTYDNVFICFGAFHTELSYFGCLGHFLDGSGGPNVLTECGVLGPSSLRGFLLGKHYNRCKRLHPLLASALQSLHFDAFLEKHGPMSDQLKEMLHELNGNPSDVVLETLEASGEYQTLMTKYQAFCDETLEGRHGSTARYWMIYISLVQRFLLFNRAVRTNDLSLFIYSLEKFIPVFFAGNRPNYSRWMIRYHLNLLNADNTHPGISKMLEDGAFSVRRTAKSFSRTAVDMTLEQTVNADAASRQTGMGSFVHSENARKRWMITRSIRSAIVSNLLSSAGLVSTEDITQDLKRNRVVKNQEDFKSIVSGIQSTMNPFEGEADESLYCLTSGQKVADQIKDDLLHFIDRGEVWSSEYREACFRDPSRFEKPIPRHKLQNFASASVKSKIPSNKKIQEVLGTRDLFGRLLFISTKEKINLEKVLEYPLTPVPLSLAHSDGSMNTTDKAKLMRKLEDLAKDPTVPLSSDVDVCIVDATFLLHIQVHPPLTFAEIARSLLSQLTHMAPQVHLVCDAYNSPSLKDAERQRRGSTDTLFRITGPDQVRPRDWQTALRSSSFKVEFLRFLSAEWMKSSYAEILANHDVYLALDDTCYCFTASDGRVARISVPALKSFHDEADTRMAFHLDFIAQVQEAANITIRTNDTDVLIILLYYMSQVDSGLQAWLDVGLISNNTRRFIYLNSMAEKLGKDVVEALPGLHALTGCDYTASFLNKGKIKPLDLMMKHEEFREALAKLGNGPLSQPTIEACEKFICRVYGKPKITNVNSARFFIFQETYAPKNLHDPLNAIKGVNPSCMPPCSKVLRKKLERANYVSKLWKRASAQRPCDSSPDENGWVLESGSYRIQWFDGDQLPSDIFGALDRNNHTPLVDEGEDEEVSYGEDLFGADEENEEDDFL